MNDHSVHAGRNSLDHLFSTPVLIQGGGDLASGVAARLWRSGFQVVMTDLAQPLAIRRSVAFAEAIYAGEFTVEGITARRASTLAQVITALGANEIPVIPEPGDHLLADLEPRVLVEATMRKRKIGTLTEVVSPDETKPAAAQLVIGLGPGFTAGQSAHAVIETNRGHYLGRVYWNGSAEPDTGVPGKIQGAGIQRVIYAPVDGVFRAAREIGDLVTAGAVVGWFEREIAVDAGADEQAEISVIAPITGVLRGIIHPGLMLPKGVKIGDIDPRGKVEHCFSISEKALAVGGGVLEAIMAFFCAGDRLPPA